MAYNDFVAIKEAVEFQFRQLKPITPETLIDDVVALTTVDKADIAFAIMNATGVCLEECIHDVETFAELADKHSNGGEPAWWECEFLLER